ncbi:hypothetical protein [Aeromonas veronii]|uniref:Phage protein n=1 Tax=Aeromonas veronii TaxID=654 RepID=A0AAW5MNN0_AERVE|nr:hypothetical protein [Aeromonas veronii]MCR4451106.1 hypothetical protein [Aeromonas veronii]
MTIKHTPEPWHLPPGDMIFVSKVGGKGYVAKMMPLGAPRDRKGLPTDISDEMCANARRIVACVNACAGVDTDLLEAGELDKPTMLMMQENKDLKHLCGELLSALETVGAHTITDEDGDEVEVLFGDMDRIQDAIAKAKGGAA